MLRTARSAVRCLPLHDHRRLLRMESTQRHEPLLLPVHLPNQGIQSWRPPGDRTRTWASPSAGCRRPHPPAARPPGGSEGRTTCGRSCRTPPWRRGRPPSPSTAPVVGPGMRRRPAEAGPAAQRAGQVLPAPARTKVLRSETRSLTWQACEKLLSRLKPALLDRKAMP